MSKGVNGEEGGGGGENGVDEGEVNGAEGTKVNGEGG